MKERLILLALNALVTGLLRAVPHNVLKENLELLMDKIDDFVEETENPYDDLLKYLTELVRESFLE